MKTLRELLMSDKTEFAMEAFNPMSAKIAMEAGFKCLWAGSLGVSASLGIRDDSEISWSEMLANIDNICDAVQVPVIVDIDTGYGDENIVGRVVHKLEKAGAAGVCIEDKLFPKLNSFVEKNQKLLEVDLFCKKLSAIKKNVSNNFVLIARLEGFIVNDSLENTIKRANSYIDAGADALVIHSKKENANEIKLFMENFRREIPVVIIPTTYYKEGVETFQKMGVSMVIWANQMTRATIKSMEAISKEIFNDLSLKNIENQMVEIDEVFRLQNLKRGQ